MAGASAPSTRPACVFHMICQRYRLHVSAHCSHWSHVRAIGESISLAMRPRSSHVLTGRAAQCVEYWATAHGFPWIAQFSMRVVGVMIAIWVSCAMQGIIFGRSAKPAIGVASAAAFSEDGGAAFRAVALWLVVVLRCEVRGGIYNAGASRRRS
jgi:hypothetical protein